MIRSVLCWLVIFLQMPVTPVWAELNLGVRYRAETGSKAYQDVVEEAKFAISEHNFRITGSNTLGAVIAARHGLSAYPQSVVIHFCNLEYAKRLLAVDPDYLLLMPCKISIRQDGERVIVETVLLADDPRARMVINEINDILTAVVHFAVE